MTYKLQEQILKEHFTPFPQGFESKSDVSDNGRLTFHQSNFFTSLLPQFKEYTDKALSLLQGVSGIEVLSTEVPATTSVYFKAGLKCKINFIS